LINEVELVALIIPTRRFAATSPLKGEVEVHGPSFSSIIVRSLQMPI
jgi:hypothetical protein